MEMVYDKLQISTDALEEAYSKWGIQINPAKCKVMSKDPGKIHTTSHSKMALQLTKHISYFIFQGSNVPKVEDDVKRRISI